MSMQLDYVAPKNCRNCPRLASYIDSYKQDYPDWHNAPVPSFGSRDAPILILGLAPGLRGANATGRPFTGDFAGKILYPTLIKLKFAQGQFNACKDDGLILEGVRVANAVRCVPPQNKPVAEEIATCRQYLQKELHMMTHLKAIFVLGRIAHDTVLRHFHLKLADFPFKHNQLYKLPNHIDLISSYHCSRYNIYTKRLTQAMFEEVCVRLHAYR